LFDFKKPSGIPIHSFFVFFFFLAVWLNESNKVVDVKLVKSFRFFVLPKGNFCKLIEIPVNELYRRELKQLGFENLFEISVGKNDESE